MTLADLRALHAIIADALDTIQQQYANAQDSKYASPPPSPSVLSPPLQSSPPLDFPALNVLYDPASPAEALTTHPAVVAAINRIVAACGQIAMSVQAPFLSLCDAVMGVSTPVELFTRVADTDEVRQYHLPSCMRLLEATHTVEILRDAGPAGLHVDRIAEMNGMDARKLGERHSVRSFGWSVANGALPSSVLLIPDVVFPSIRVASASTFRVRQLIFVTSSSCVINLLHVTAIAQSFLSNKSS
jgi:hypothetical protein